MARPKGSVSSGACAKAFGEGSDARLAGLSVSANPYGSETSEFRAWENGWHDVNVFFGHHVRGRWAYRKPAAVRREVQV